MESSQATFAGAVACSDLATDETLVATAQMGDERAFETLVKRHRPRILRLHYATLGFAKMLKMLSSRLSKKRSST
jgi:hypothetical protein